MADPLDEAFAAINEAINPNKSDAPAPIQKGDPLAGVDIRQALLKPSATDVQSGLTDGTEVAPRKDYDSDLDFQAKLQSGKTALEQEQAFHDVGKRAITAIDAGRVSELYHWSDDPYAREEHRSNLLIAQQAGAQLRQSEEAGGNWAWAFTLRQNGYDPLTFNPDEHDDEDELLELVDQTEAILAAGRIAAVEDAEHDLATTQQEYAETLVQKQEEAFVNFFAQVRDPAKRGQAYELVMEQAAIMYGGDLEQAQRELFSLPPEAIPEVLETLASAAAAVKQAQFRSGFENMLRGAGERDISAGYSKDSASPARGVDYIHQPMVQMSDIEAVLPVERDMTQAEVIAAIQGTTVSDKIGAATSVLYKKAQADLEAEAKRRRR